jgi:hypothetical protein
MWIGAMPRVDGWLPLAVGSGLLGACAQQQSWAWGWLAAAAYCLVVAALRSHRQRQLQARASFDDANQQQRTAHVGCDAKPLSWSIAFLEIPILVDLATEFGFLATFAVPSISAVLLGSGAFRDAPQKRYDDTSIIMHEVGENGAASARGSRALERLNAIHAQFPIQNRDFLYVLWIFCYEPQRWIDRGWAWRGLHPEERASLFAFWMEVGKQMEIQDLPRTDDEFRAFGPAFEARHWRPAPQNRVVTAQLLDLVVRWGPRIIPARLKRSVVSLAIGSIGSPQLLAAIGQPPAPLPIRAAVHVLLLLSGWVGAMLPPRPRWLARTTLLQPQCPVAAGGRHGLSSARPCPASVAYRASPEYPSYQHAGSYTMEELGPASISAEVEATERERRRRAAAVARGGACEPRTRGGGGGGGGQNESRRRALD